MKVDCKQTGTPLPHLWSMCVGAGRAREGLRRDWQDQLRQAVADCGFRYIRFHGLLAEDMFVVHHREEELIYNWSYVDAVYDALQQIGVRPVVELSFMPPTLASGSGTLFWWRANVTPPADLSEWARLIGALTRHFVERYGLDEVRQWYFEVWNEPNLHAFWQGTRSQYFALYKASVQAIKAVDSRLRVGGPATSNFVPDDRFAGETEDLTRHKTHQARDLDALDWQGVWIDEFLTYCAAEKLPVDFVSTHPYPTDFALDGQQTLRGRSRGVDSLQKDIAWLREHVHRSAYPGAPLLLTEWSSSPTSRDYSHDFLPAANYIVHCNLQNAGRAQALSYWTFTDIFEEEGGGPEAFHGGFGLLNTQGIRKPAYWAYVFLHRLGEQVLLRGEQSIVTRSADGRIQALFYNYDRGLHQAVPIAEYPDLQAAAAIEDSGVSRSETLEVTGLTPGTPFCLRTLDKAHTTTTLWRQMGAPANLTRSQYEALRAAAPATQTLCAGENGVLHLDITLQPWSLVLLEQLDSRGGDCHG